jgi:hypothetical protein
MYDVAQSIRAYLLTKTAITDVVGQRIYADQLPQNATLPAIEMAVISDVPEMQLSDITGLTKARIQFVCFATTRRITRQISQAIRTCGVAAIKGLYSGVWIKGVAVDGSFDATIPPSDGNDIHRYLTTVDLVVDYLEA